ncbi:Pre-mRNA-splicing factor sap61 [Coemansia biformis]|uniref:Pre-mRNA-splicing factor sap61 n=1 Tax=Coemansia biformis TaxID=1286918 RepID=A0A9W7YI74_9FUNG|nr:Pre-mRNA-splicing factor sap61 [Coemansia biformis]
MDSIVEQQRQAHEDIERLEQAVVDLMIQNLTKHRHRLIREHKISELLDEIQGRSKLLGALAEDESGLRAKEAAALASRGFDEFYARLGAVGDYHRRNPGVAVRLPELDYVKYKNNPEDAEAASRARKALGEEEQDALAAHADNGDSDGGDVAAETFMSSADESRLEVAFSGEERLGRYVDLNAQHERYLNAPGARRVTYLEYLAMFCEFGDHPRKAKDARYSEYLGGLREYLEGFFARAMPLFDLPATRRQAHDEFAAAWAKGQVPGWEPAAATAGGDAERLYCAPCKRQFEKDTTYQAHMGSRKHEKTVARLQGEQGGADPARAQRAEREREIAWTEFLVRRYAQVLASKIGDTRANVQRRQALTEAERNQELEEDEVEIAEAPEDRDDQIYNPLNLPMGWDGKPIPFWLYKLHGLGATFDCEICGNAVYRGRKAYERHFQEARHTTNMRRLGIPNTRQFHGVASIDDAQALWARVQKEKRGGPASADTFEEYEDSEGNVFNKKTYLDLKRQGLI